MKRWIRSISFLFLFLSLFTNKAWALPGSKALVKIFCEEMLYLTNHGEKIGQTKEEWREFISRLESREPLIASESETKLFQDAFGFDQCLQQFGPRFTEAEFILDGMVHLAESLEQLRNAQSTPRSRLGEMLPAEGRNLNSPYGNLVIRGDEAPLAIDEDDMKVRHAHYLKLWREFLDGLHKRLTKTASLDFD